MNHAVVSRSEHDVIASSLLTSGDSHLVVGHLKQIHPQQLRLLLWCHLYNQPSLVPKPPRLRDKIWEWPGNEAKTIYHYSAAVILRFPPNEADYNIKHNLEPEYDFHAVNQVNSIMNILYVMNG